MNRTMTSLLAIGVGVAAYQLAQRNNLMNGRTMRKMRRRLMQAIR
ncbi:MULTISPECIES: YrzQ family protein [Geobacillus]|jgi:hypothetical protein|uniref:YrzQ family protein n=1 Tax=Geobacillus thermodenitrificans TaxID=33940 RepID=A0ABY9Q975_GEOTD|nr:MULTISPECIES: YrzQ family protein [Geobacillus]ARP43585.1 hypothetical protein GTHT12_02061 [Geobacillus thermodenitrificans]KQB92403.1 putative membrane protein [Geobacillus sp. PA-3]MEC5187282.1 hypothetical protein [Geobacillus thermodenitrificans]MED0662639.1 DUF3918 domain-containing protein [Geobacillus thermodenitrificans]MED3716601.1 YrzQ family protein [Geobacillus thermodenitrificans]